MMINKQKSYGQKYNFVQIKIKLNKKIILKILIIMLFFVEIILGALWALGY